MVGEAITVLVVDGHQTFAELLGVALAGQPELRYIGHARTGEQAIRLVQELRPNVVLLDPDLPDADGIAIAELLRHRQPDTRFVILTANNESALVGRATAADASGFLSKNGPLGDVLNAVHTAHGGGMTVSTDILARLLRSTSPVVGPRAGWADRARARGAGPDGLRARPAGHRPAARHQRAHVPRLREGRAGQTRRAQPAGGGRGRHPPGPTQPAQK
nr:hypothetical protein GCM10020092_093420 [Actinoplanes digitatis]